MRRFYLITYIGVLWFGIFVSSAIAEQTAQELSARALEECQRGRIATERDVRMKHFEQAEVIAEQAIQADDNHAEAHFSLFCTLGEQMRIDGEPTIGAIFGYNRMMDELNRTLELAPDHIDALSSKGTLLVKLPSIMGGDSAKGVEILREVIKREPMAINARLVIAESIADDGKHEEALNLAMTALKIAKDQNRQDLIPEAEETLANLQNGTGKH
ncbi:MAG: hypothetical protein NPIRA04_24430 [Nitrospirales bacterium]|nr:MAG: hypothetical protein NPIRA04_24430 [Nitrospirales bacterium]